MSDTDTLRSLQEERIGQIKALESLEGNDGWKLLQRVVEAQMLGLKQNLFNTRVESLDQAIQSAGNLAELTGMKTVLGLPQVMVESIRQELEAIRLEITQLEQDNGDGSDDLG